MQVGCLIQWFDLRFKNETELQIYHSLSHAPLFFPMYALQLNANIWHINPYIDIDSDIMFFFSSNC